MECLLFAQQGGPAPDVGAGVAGGIVSFMCFAWVLGLIASIFWLWMLIDALVNEPETNQKILWFLVIFFLHILGALVYFFVRRSNRTRATPGV